MKQIFSKLFLIISFIYLQIPHQVNAQTPESGLAINQYKYTFLLILSILISLTGGYFISSALKKFLLKKQTPFLSQLGTDLYQQPQPEQPSRIKRSRHKIVELVKNKKTFASLKTISLILLGGIIGYYSGLRQNPIPQASIASENNSFLSQQYIKTISTAKINFFNNLYAKYPPPDSITPPEGLEDELYKAYTSSISRSNFKLNKYFNDNTAYGQIYFKNGESVEKNMTTWTMNKIGGKWIVVFPAQQNYPECSFIKPLISVLKQTQGICYESDKLIDGLHPGEEYNNYSL